MILICCYAKKRYMRRVLELYMYEYVRVQSYRALSTAVARESSIVYYFYSGMQYPVMAR
jgi:hypothetical protein